MKQLKREKRPAVIMILMPSAIILLNVILLFHHQFIRETSGLTSTLKSKQLISRPTRSFPELAPNKQQLLPVISNQPARPRTGSFTRIAAELFEPIVDPMTSKREPRWLNPCHKPTDHLPRFALDHQALLARQAIRSSLASVTQVPLEDNEASSTLSQVSSGSSASRRKRKRRSIITGSMMKRGASINSIEELERSAIVFKRTGQQEPKRTSFSFLINSQHLPRSPISSKHIKFYHHEVPLLYEVSETSDKSTKQSSAQREKVIKGEPAEVAPIFINNLRISFKINQALLTANVTHQIVSDILRLLLATEESSTFNQRKHGLELRTWLPAFRSLLIHQDFHLHLKVDGEGDKMESPDLFINISHYIQFFSMAFEQLIYDSYSKFGRQHQLTRAYQNLAKLTLKVLCEISTLTDLFHTNRKLLEPWMIPHWSIHSSLPKEVLNFKQRLYYLNETVLISPLKHLTHKQPKERFVGREMWPKEYRSRLNQSKDEQYVRDSSIITDFRELLEFYINALSLIYHSS